MSMSLPTLYKLTSTGKIQEWTIYVDKSLVNGPVATLITQYGQIGGAIQEAREQITEGKNLGKSNETDAFAQADLEAKSQWEKKVKKGYVQNIEDAQNKVIDTNFITGGVEPMLAQSYDKHASKITYPAYVQPKLDGHRCIAIIQDGKCTLWSRTRKPITGVPHIVREFEHILGNTEGTYIFDGELYNHDYREKFEELTSFIRSATPKSGHEVVQYVIYDLVEDGTYQQREEKLDRYALQLNGTSLGVLPAFPVEDEDEMINLFGVFLEQGYEGLMIRNKEGIYKNKRSYDLQKVKVMADAEFEVTDVTEGKGKMAGKAMFHCKTDDGKEFRVKMVGKLDDLTHYLDHKDEYIGRQLTVKYQNMSADGIPRFPIALRFREDV